MGICQGLLVSEMTVPNLDPVTNNSTANGVNRSEDLLDDYSKESPSETAEMYSVDAVGAESKGGKFSKFAIERNTCGPDDITIDIKYCGICHTDVHYVMDDMPMPVPFPLVPGHEIAGVVTQVGKNVKDMKVGDHAGIGAFIDSCLDCKPCNGGDENGCAKGCTFTYGGEAAAHGGLSTDSGFTMGGYCKSITANRHFTCKIPENYPLKSAGPVFCAGITMYTPLKDWGALKGGLNVGIVGIGGLGQMGVRLAAAMGNEVTAISTKQSKEEMALKMGAKHFIVSKDEEQMKAAEGTFDLIINTVSANHQVSTYLPLLAWKGKIIQVGLAMEPHEIVQLSMIFKMITIAGSVTGGMAATQECIDFCAEKGIEPEIELIDWTQLDDVYQDLSTSADKVVRYVLDIEKSFK